MSNIVTITYKTKDEGWFGTRTVELPEDAELLQVKREQETSSEYVKVHMRGSQHHTFKNPDKVGVGDWVIVFDGLTKQPVVRMVESFTTEDRYVGTPPSAYAVPRGVGQ